MSSVTSILNQLPFKVAARKEVYFNPTLTYQVSLPGMSGTFKDAVVNRKVLATFVSYPSSHSMVIYDITEDKVILKDTYKSMKTQEYLITDETAPSVGYFVGFKQITEQTTDNVETLVALNLKEMEFDKDLIQRVLDREPALKTDLDAALQAIYTAQTNS